MYFHQINSPLDEQMLLKEMIELDTKVRMDKEKARLRDNARSATYEKIFDPITKKMEAVAERTPAPSGDLTTFEEKPPIVTPPPSPELKPDLYTQTLAKIPRRERDSDGILGLDSTKNIIGSRAYTVNDNVLHVQNEDGSFTDITIDDPTVWQILLLKNPRTLGENPSNASAVEKYRDIVKKLELVERITGKHVKTRNKYQLLSRTGKGFLFTTSPPPIVIPSNPKRLIRCLIQALAELRAGNEAMRNVVVQFAQEAKAKNILPPKLLTEEEMTWVYS